jgi:hypothetical protein
MAKSKGTPPTKEEKNQAKLVYQKALNDAKNAKKN